MSTSSGTLLTLDEVAGILDAPASEGIPAELAEIERFRSATRRIWEEEASLTLVDQLLAVDALRLLARKATLSQWCVEVVAIETLPHVSDMPAPAPPKLDAARAHQRLSRAGYRTCPSCLRDLWSPAEIERLERLHQESIRSSAKLVVDGRRHD